MIAKILEKNFEKFDENLRNELLLRFANSLNKNIKFYASKIVSKHSKIIPEDLHKFFLILLSCFQQHVSLPHLCNFHSKFLYSYKPFAIS